MQLSMLQRSMYLPSNQGRQAQLKLRQPFALQLQSTRFHIIDKQHNDSANKIHYTKNIHHRLNESPENTTKPSTTIAKHRHWLDNGSYKASLQASSEIWQQRRAISVAWHGVLLAVLLSVAPWSSTELPLAHLGRH